MHPDMVRIIQQQTMEAMLSGGMEKISNLAGVTDKARATLNRQSATAKAIFNPTQVRSKSREKKKRRGVF